MNKPNKSGDTAALWVAALILILLGFAGGIEHPEKPEIQFVYTE